MHMMADLRGISNKLYNGNFMKPLKNCKWFNKRHIMQLVGRVGNFIYSNIKGTMHIFYANFSILHLDNLLMELITYYCYC